MKQPAAFPAILATALVLAFARASAAGVESAYDNDTDGMVPGPRDADRDYTFGARTTWSAEPGALPRWASRVADRLGGAGPRPGRRFALALGQELYTPDKLSTPALITNDRPYAAWLYGGVTLANAGTHAQRSLDLRVGLVGPAAQGREVQTWWHRRNHIRLPRGWSHQLGNEVAFRATLEQRWRPWGAARHLDVVPHARVTAGTLLDEAAAGATLRIGTRLANDFGPGIAGAAEAHPQGLRLYAWARGEGRAVARDLFLDGSTFAASPRVHRIPLVGAAEFGAEARWGALGLRYTYAHNSATFRERPDFQEYGSVALSF